MSGTNKDSYILTLSHAHVNSHILHSYIPTILHSKVIKNIQQR